MKRWTEADIRNANIVDYEQFNNEYNASKSTINGGLDRNQIPQNIVGKNNIKDNATHTVYFNDEPEFATDTFNVDASSGVGLHTGFRGLTYSTYSGGWITVVDREYTGLKDGMMQIEFMAHLYINLQFSRGDGEINQKGVQFQIEWNGVPMLNTFDFAKPIQTIRLFANTFSPGGTGKLTIKAKMTPKGKTDWLHRTQFHIFGIRTMLIGRWR
tara:strand:- start:1519 stop:2157 length:639 start_codon:yes stop_codon:yes gene_type:complete